MIVKMYLFLVYVSFRISFCSQHILIRDDICVCIDLFFFNLKDVSSKRHSSIGERVVPISHCGLHRLTWFDTLRNAKFPVVPADLQVNINIFIHI